jgi:hypothetical protein
LEVLAICVRGDIGGEALPEGDASEIGETG